MKVVLFCGGTGLRLADGEEPVPKPMMPIGYRPILWHVMRYYAHFGHREFILCLGYKSDLIKQYFLSYDETLSNDFILEKGGEQITLLKSDIDDWSIAFVDTGLDSNIGQRLLSVRRFVDDDEMFLANYADVLTDADLPSMIESFSRRGSCAQMIAVPPNHTFHLVESESDGMVTGMTDVGMANLWIDGGYYVFRREIFDVIGAGEELVREPFERASAAGALAAYRHRGFWARMETLKDKQLLEEIYDTGNRPWCVWERNET